MMLRNLIYYAKNTPAPLLKRRVKGLTLSSMNCFRGVVRNKSRLSILSFYLRRSTHIIYTYAKIFYVNMKFRGFIGLRTAFLPTISLKFVNYIDNLL